jgi:hypothetical protein
MGWLSGKPRRIITLTWPTNDYLIEQATASSYEPLGTYSVLDDQVLRAVTVREPNEHFTSIYLARLHQAIATGASTVAFIKMTMLPYAAHRTSLLPGNAGFATLEFAQRFVMDQKSYIARIN